jgi:hypothetical protein
MANVKTIEWNTLEHPYYEKKADWFWIVGIIGGLLAFLGLVFSNVLFAILIIIATVVVIVHGSKVPDQVRIRLGPDAVHVGGIMYPYTELRSFSISEEDDPEILTLVRSGGYNTHVRIIVEDVKIEDVRAYLLEHIDESYHEPHLTEAIMDYIGF